MILTPEEAADILRLDNASNYPQLDIILPAIDEYMKTATGFDWGTITETYQSINPTAKMAATMLLVQWFENPAMIGKVDEGSYGLTNLIKQLQAKALPEVTV